MEDLDVLVSQTISYVKTCSPGHSRLLKPEFTSYLEAIEFADKLNSAYSGAKFEALRGTPYARVSFKKL